MKSDLIEQVIDLAVEIQQIAAPPFGERQRAEFVRDQFSQDGLSDVSMDELVPGRQRIRWVGVCHDRHVSLCEVIP